MMDKLISTNKAFIELKKCNNDTPLSVVHTLCEDMWNELSKNDLTYLFYLVMFHVGDQDRLHWYLEKQNIKDMSFKGEGNVFTAQRMYKWLSEKVQEDLVIDETMLGFLKEHIGWKFLTKPYMHRTYNLFKDKRSGVKISENNIIYDKRLARYIASQLNQEGYERSLMVKHLTRIKSIASAQSKNMLPETKKKRIAMVRFMYMIAQEMGMSKHQWNQFLKKHESSVESLIAKGDFQKLTPKQFTDYLSNLSGGAQKRVSDMINKDKKKWDAFYDALKQWHEREKKQIQKAVVEKHTTRSMSVKVKSKIHKAQSSDDLILDYIEAFVNGRDTSSLGLEIDNKFLSTHNEVNAHVHIDNSGSMYGFSYGSRNAQSIHKAIVIGTLLMSLDREQGMYGFWADHAKFPWFGKQQKPKRNSRLQRTRHKVTVEIPRINPVDGFDANFRRGMEIAQSIDVGHSTNVASIFDLYKSSIDAGYMNADEIPPSLIIVTDMGFNNGSSPYTSMMTMLNQFDYHYGIRPILFIIDVSSNVNDVSEQSDHGVITIDGFNINILNSIVEHTGGKIRYNSKLEALSKSPRYSKVKEHILRELDEKPIEDYE